MEYWKILLLRNLFGEKWRPIIGFESLYEVSNLGRIRSLERVCFNGAGYFIKPSRIMRQGFDKDGYLFITLHSLNKKAHTKKVHRLVGQAYIPNPDNKKTINHIFGVKTDNRSFVLEWHTDLENKTHAKKYGLMRGNGKNLIQEREKQKKPILQFSMDMVFIQEHPSFNSAPANKSRIWLYMKGLSSHAGGFRWRYKKENETYAY